MHVNKKLMNKNNKLTVYKITAADEHVAQLFTL